MAHPNHPFQPQRSLDYPQPPYLSPSVNTASGPKSRTKSIVSPKPQSPAPPPAVAGGPFKYEELEFATNGFAESIVLEGEIFSWVHHQNWVSLVGYCEHKDQRLLVYEYVPNKTLDFHLHGMGVAGPTLNWSRRWKIDLGTAKGLAYLHEDCDPKIIHRDIKAASILLDYSFEPKVSDFELAKLVPTNMTHVDTRIMGTFGYVDPEYVISGKFTDRSHVYSYGVMLLELITGRKPIMSSDPEMDQSLVNWARPLLSRAIYGDIGELIDPWLETNSDQYDMLRLIHCAGSVVRHSTRKRPRMGQVN